jgi:hypothetical protein
VSSQEQIRKAAEAARQYNEHTRRQPAGQQARGRG